MRPAFVSFTAKISAGRREVQTGRGSTHAARHTATALPALSRGLALRPPATRTRLCTRFDVGGDHRGDAVSRRRNQGRRSSAFTGSATGTCVCSCTASLHQGRNHKTIQLCRPWPACASFSPARWLGPDDCGDRIGGGPEYPQAIQGDLRGILLERAGFQGGAVNFSILKSSSAMRLSDRRLIPHLWNQAPREEDADDSASD